MKKLNRILSLVVVLCMVFTMLPTSVLAAAKEESSGWIGSEKVENTLSLKESSQALKENYPAQAEDASAAAFAEVSATKIDALDVDLKSNDEMDVEPVGEAAYAANETVRVIVVLEGESLLAQGFSKDQLTSVSAVNAVKTMQTKQDVVLDSINAAVSSLAINGVRSNTKIEAKYNYSIALNGIAVEVPFGALDSIRAINGVETAFVAPQYDLPESVDSETIGTNMYATSGSFGSAQTWEELGYTGEGMRVAVIDTGIDSDHPSFSGENFPTTETSLTLKELEFVLDDLNAAEIFSGLKAEDLYVSAKIPYAFNYVDESLDETHDNDSAGDHGTHVAGIVAANKLDSTSVVGVAPDAQLIVMKVFGANGGAYFDDIMAALEDCFRLNVDAVNMSLGSPAGFSDAESDEYVKNLFDTIKSTDMVVSVSAGNSYSAAYSNLLGTDVNFSWDPDNGIVGSPATYSGATMVASLENTSYMTEYFTIEGKDGKYAYSDASTTSTSTMRLAFYGLAKEESGTAYDYVMIPGSGSAENFEGLDVEGKIAVIFRGTIDFTSKQTNAYNAGAVACIVYNNVETDDNMYMMNAGLLPNVFVSMATGAALNEAAGEDGVGKLTVFPAGNMTVVESSSAGQMSDFSSWGVAPDLQLVPDVTAPGGNIYSCYTDGQYGMMSGTSMSAPHIAGMSALVIQHLDEEYTLSDAETHTVAEALIMSTAVPVTEFVDDDGNEVPYSPRKQGAGSANVYNAVTSAAYLTVDGSTPKVSMGDDDACTGRYVFSFEINNMSDKEQTYVLDSTVLTDQVLQAYGLTFMGETSKLLESKVEFTYISDYSALSLLDANSDGVFDAQDVSGEDDWRAAVLDSIPLESVTDAVCVPANSRIVITATLQLTDADMEYMDANYLNGIYVDGFVRCYGVTAGAADLSLPFMGFYGDWSAADVFDTAWYYEDDLCNRYWHVLYTNYGDTAFYLGGNPYIAEDHDPAHNVLSPNGDGYQDYIKEIYLSMMRNARYVDFNWVDDATGEILYNSTAEYVRKSYYYSAYGINMPFVYGSYLKNIYDYTDASGNALADGTRLSLYIDGYLDDGDHSEPDQSLEATPIVIDTTAPELDVDSIEFIKDEGTGARSIRVTVSDNYDIAAVVSMTPAGDTYEYMAANTKAEGDEGETATIEIDVSDYDSTFVLAVCDYGCNESYYEINFSDESYLNADKFYAYRRYAAVDIEYNGTAYIYLTDAYNGWCSFTSPDSMMMHTAMYDGEAAVDAAEYIDGYIFGVDVNGEIFAMKAGSWDRIPLGTMPTTRDSNYDEVPYPALDMAYDYANDVLYILTDELTYGAGGHLMTLDYLTGEVTDLGTVTTVEGSQPLTLACDNSGVLYTIDYMSGDLYTIDVENPTIKEAENWWQDDQVIYECDLVGETGYVPGYVQTMAVDHETDELYWLAYSSATSAGSSVMYQVNKTTGELTKVDNVEYNSEMTALFKPYDSGKDIIPDAELEELLLSDYSFTIGVGAMEEVQVYPEPYNAEYGDLEWSSSDESVAVVIDGVIYAVGEGSAEITVKYVITAADLYDVDGDGDADTDDVQMLLDGVNGLGSMGEALVAKYDLNEDGAVDTADVQLMYERILSDYTVEYSAVCVVEVVNLSADLTLYDMGNSYSWQTLNANAPSEAVYLEEATNPYNGFTAAAYFNGDVYAVEYGGNFYRLDPETMQGTQIGFSGSNLFGLAFNYADGYMYGIEQAQVSMWESYNYLVRVNLNTGALERVEQISSDYTVLGSLAIDYEGSIYAICSDNWTYDVVLVQWNVGEDGLTVKNSWSMGEFGWNISNYTCMTYSAADEGIFYSDSMGGLNWIDINSLTADNETPRIVSLGYIGEATGYAMNMAMFTVPEVEPELPEVEVTQVSVPESYMLLAGGSVSAGVTVEPWNAYPTVTYAIADEDIAAVSADGTITGLAVGSTTLTVTVEGWEESTEIPVTVAAPTGTLYGFLITDFMYGSGFFVGFADSDPVNEIEYASDYTDFYVFSGAYYDGMIYGYGQDQTGEFDYKNYFLTIDADTFRITRGEKIHYTLRDMAMDYTSNNVYAIAEGAGYAGAVAMVDRETGEVTIIADTGIPFAAMTIDAKGQMYGIGEDDNLYAIDKASGEIELIADTGVDAGAQFQSMHYDLDTGNTYWAQVADDQTSSLRIVDLAIGSTTSLGTISSSGAQIGALYSIPGEEPTEPDEDTFQVTGIKLPESAAVIKGETLQLKATVLTSVELKPGAISTDAVSAADVTLTWSSSDENVAAVDANGLVTGIAAGEAVITASAEGHSAACKVVVTEGERERLLYAYDETNAQWISFTATTPGTVNTERADAEGEAKLVASAYTGEIIYAYDAEGKFLSVDPETFERTSLGDGIVGQTYTTVTTDWWGDTYEIECELSVTDLSYDNGTLYAAVNATYDGSSVMGLLCTVDVTTGALTVVFESNEILPTNLLVDNGMAYFVDGFMSGLLTYVDMTADKFAYSQAALVQGYWGYAEASVGLFKDQITGTVYALRDFTETGGEYDDDWNFIPWDGVTGNATLCTLNLADADIAELGTVGSGLLLSGLFIK